MKKSIKKVMILLFIVSSFYSAVSYANSVAVIINNKNTAEISRSTIKSIYSDVQFEWSNGSRITLFELPLSSSERETFAQETLNQSAQESQIAWNNRKITNVINNRPKTKRDKLVLKRVSRDINAIGYIPLSMAKNAKGVRIVLIIN
jgi:ABC-type phosphate transport system substrate-binding protein